MLCLFRTFGQICDLAVLLWHCTDIFRHSLVQLLELVQKKFGNLVFVASHCQVERGAALSILQVVCGTMFVDQTLHWILVTFKRCPMKCWVSRKYAQWQLNSLYRFSIRLPELCWFSVHIGRPNFWRILQSPFFGFLGICMCGPVEDLVQGCQFLMEPERFIKFFNCNILKIIL